MTALTRADVDRIVADARAAGRRADLRSANLVGADLRSANLVVAGCWSGTLDELADRISPDGPHGWGEDAERWRADYGAVIAMARVRVAEWEAEPLTAADHERWKATR